MGKIKNKGKHHHKGGTRYKGKRKVNDDKKIIEYEKEEKIKNLEKDTFVPENEIEEQVSLEEMLEIVRKEIKDAKNNRKHNKQEVKTSEKTKAKDETKTKTKSKTTRKEKKEKKKSSKAKRVILTLIQIILIGVMIYSGYKIYIWYRDNQESNTLKEELEVAVTETNVNEDGSLDAKNYDIDFERLKQTNKDVVGWLKVNNTNIEYPVVHTTNNEFYLNHTLNKNVNGAGWPFLDYHEKLDGTDKNLVIYGHNRKDASMFGTLKDTLKPEWYENKANKTVVYITPTEKSNYEVFSVYQIAVEDYYITTQFNNTQFGNFVEKLKKRSAYDFGVEVNENDTILTLSTCSGNDYRTVLHARKIINE